MSDTALNWGLGIATLCVLLGVVLEGAEFAAEIKKRGWQLRNCFKLVEKIGFALLVLGLSGEWYFSTTIHDRDSERISTQGNDLKLAGIHLLDRHVDIDKLALLGAGSVAEYPGQKLVLKVVPNDGEAQGLAEELRNALSSILGGHWNVKIVPFTLPPQGSLEVREPIPPGIFGPFSANPAQEPEASGALMEFLGVNNFCWYPVKWTGFADPAPTTLTLVISHKDRTSKEGCL